MLIINLTVIEKQSCSLFARTVKTGLLKLVTITVTLCCYCAHDLKPQRCEYTSGGQKEERRKKGTSFITEKFAARSITTCGSKK